MAGWKRLFDQRRWDAIENLWPTLSLGDQRTLLAALRDGVPKVTVTDGMEQLERHVRPSEAPPEWKGGAQILALGELEAKIEGDPALASSSWSSLRGDAQTYLRETITQCEKQPKAKNAPGELSQEQHCRDSLELLGAIDRVTQRMCAEMDSVADREWLGEIIAEIAEYAFVAGRHMQEAWGKPFEGHAVRGIKTLKSAVEGGEKRKGKLAPDSLKIVAYMQQQIDAGKSQSEAAYRAKAKGLGTSQAANLRLYQRMKRAKT